MEWPHSLGLVVSNTDAVVRWCTLALVVSGTVTLQIARQHRPMVIVYKIGRVSWNLVARWIIKSSFITLPNILAGREIVPELIPSFLGVDPIAQRATELLEDRAKYDLQVRELTGVTDKFAGMNAARGAADIIAQYAGLEPVCGSDGDGEEADCDAGVAGAVGD